jgi:hypothetical protein
MTAVFSNEYSGLPALHMGRNVLYAVMGITTSVLIG